MSLRDAALVTIAAVRRSVKNDEGKSTELGISRQWKKLAEGYGIEAEEDPDLALERKERALAAILAEEGMGDD